MKINKNIVLSFVVMTFFAILWFALMYYRLPIGDDILTQHTTGINVYLGNPDHSIGVLISSLSQVWGKMVYEYQMWNGRVLGVLLEPALILFGQGFTAFVSVVIYTGVVLSCGVLAFGSLKGTLNRPLAIFVFSIMLFWYNSAMGKMTMWVITSIYGLTILMYLLYMIVLKKTISAQFKVSMKWIVLMNIFGFLVGITHEALGAIGLAVIFTRTLVSVFQQNAGLKKFFIHSGLFAGYIVAFLAPGNFNRMLQEHDSEGLAVSYFQRLLNSYDAHIKVLGGTYEIVTIILTLLFFLFIFTLLPTTKEKLKELALNNLEYIVGIVVSICLWAAVSYTPYYGTLLWVAFVLIFLFRNIEIDPKLNRFWLVLLISIYLVYTTGMREYPWLNTLRTTTTQWRSILTDAKEEGLTEVVVPMYPPLTSNMFTIKNYANKQENYDRDYYRSYYGIHIIVEQE